MPTRAEIEAAILGVTGAPDTGVVRAVTPAIVDAMDALCNPAPAKGGKAAQSDAEPDA